MINNIFSNLPDETLIEMVYFAKRVLRYTAIVPDMEIETILAKGGKGPSLEAHKAVIAFVEEIQKAESKALGDFGSKERAKYSNLLDGEMDNLIQRNSKISSSRSKEILEGLEDFSSAAVPMPATISTSSGLEDVQLQRSALRSFFDRVWLPQNRIRKIGLIAIGSLVIIVLVVPSIIAVFFLVAGFPFSGAAAGSRRKSEELRSAAHLTKPSPGYLKALLITQDLESLLTTRNPPKDKDRKDKVDRDKQALGNLLETNPDDHALALIAYGLLLCERSSGNSHDFHSVAAWAANNLTDSEYTFPIRVYWAENLARANSLDEAISVYQKLDKEATDDVPAFVSSEDPPRLIEDGKAFVGKRLNELRLEKEHQEADLEFQKNLQSANFRICDSTANSGMADVVAGALRSHGLATTTQEGVWKPEWPSHVKPDANYLKAYIYYRGKPSQQTLKRLTSLVFEVLQGKRPKSQRPKSQNYEYAVDLAVKPEFEKHVDISFLIILGQDSER